MRNSWILLLALTAIVVTAGRAQSAEWQQLWNGKDFTGWQHIGYGRFVIEDGVLKTEGVPGTLGLLYYKEKVGDCVLRVVYKELPPGKSNSGVYIRIPKEPTDEQEVVRIAHEIQVGGTTTGEIFAVSRALTPPPLKLGADDWNTVEITIEGPHTVVTVNGEKVTDFTQGVSPTRPNLRDYYNAMRPDVGWFGLQNHNRDVVWFKEVSIKRLPKK
ncbi:MAG: DUF1080 domain-containing protein [Candidatus Solibacter sp.]|nr:DUF1080 domain-containing protein [Candidatus Solibacter sp.]